MPSEAELRTAERKGGWWQDERVGEREERDCAAESQAAARHSQEFGEEAAELKSM